MRHVPKIALGAAALLLAGLPMLSLAQNDSAPARSGTQANTAAAAASNAKTPHNDNFANQTQRDSYAVGLQIGKNLKKQSLRIDAKSLTQGVMDAIHGNKPAMSKTELRQTLTGLQKRMRAEQMAKRQAAAKENKLQGQALLQKNKQKKGVKVTDDGLQYKVLKKGSGQSPKDGDTVKVNYKGTFPSGKVFDSSYQRGKPATFKVGQVIPGWSEALKMMKPGAKYHLVIPADLAYGARGQPPIIEPNQVLVFDVELLKVNPKGSESGGSSSAGQ